MPSKINWSKEASVIAPFFKLWSALAVGFIMLAAPLPAQFVYVTNAGSNAVSAYSIDRKTGALTPVPGSPFLAGVVPFSVAVDPADRFVYVANVGNDPLVEGTVSAYSIDDKTGALTPLPASPFAAGAFPCSVAVDSTARFAYVANAYGNTVSGYSIDRKTGALTPVPVSPFATGSEPLSVAVDPTARFAYVANSFGTVSGYSIDRKTGALTPVPGSPFAAGPFPLSVAVDPTAQFAYVGNQIGNNPVNPGTVSGYSIDRKTGALTPVPGSPFPTGSQPTSVAVDPTAQFAYVANFYDNTVSGYSIDRKTGALTPVPGSPFATREGPRSVAVDPTARFAYVANNANTVSSVSGYSIDRKTGALTPVPGSPFATGYSPTSVAITRH